MGFSHFQNNHNDLDPFCKADLDLLGGFEEKTPSYN